MVARSYVSVLNLVGERGHNLLFPDFPGCISSGSTRREAEENALEALCLHVEGMIEDAVALPEPSPVDAPPPDWLADVDLSRSIRILVSIEIDGRSVRGRAVP